MYWNYVELDEVIYVFINEGLYGILNFQCPSERYGKFSYLIYVFFFHFIRNA